ncbi:U2 snRNP auxilliary factor, large subunit, splicing factor, partial [Sesbania bispinosa]
HGICDCGLCIPIGLFLYAQYNADYEASLSLLCLFFISMDLVIMTENLPEAGTRNERKGEKGREKGRRGGTGIGTRREAGTGIQREAGTGTEIGREAKTGNEIGMGRKKGTVTTIIEIDIGIVVREVKGEGIEEMMMIITEAGTMTGNLLSYIRSHNFMFKTLAIKRTSGFDMAPPATAMLAGASAVAGQIPGANPAIPGMFPNMFPLATSQPFSALPVMPVQAMTQQATRHARRVYVGGLPPTANEQSVATFFSQVMAKIGGNTAGPGDAVVNVYINHDKKFAFVEMRSVEEASNAMALDGIIFEGAPVKVRRPTDYNPSLAATLGPSQPNPNLNLGAVGLTPGSAGGLDGPDRIFVGGLPYYFTETQIRELLETFGPLRGFDLVKDRETGNSKGYAFCVYQDLAVTDIACAALNGIKMGDKTLTVRRANQGANPQQPKPEQESILMHAQQQIALQKLMLQPALVATKVVCLTHAVSADELKDDEDYEEILDDMRQECSKFGSLVNVVIPRPQPNDELTPGVGKVFLEYVDVDGATKARAGLNGRKFGGNQVIAVFYPENKFAQGDYEG